MPIRRDALACPWKGVNIGGWLLLEPGPSHPLFSQHLLQGAQEARCEWDFLKGLQQAKGKAYTAEVIRKHRETHITKADFELIRECGLNAVRLPIGYWIILGPSEGEPYEGPAFEFVDKAVDWAEACGLQIVLDLHGCPGGESGEAPCGRRQRPDGTWQWKQWRIGQTLKAIDVLAARYHKRRCVTGIAVCNEPSQDIPTAALCRYYEKAIGRIRDAGMPANRVAVLLPVFQREEGEDKFIQYWHEMTGNRHKNICFDVHCYHCFENGFNGMTLAQHMRGVQENADMLRKYPMVVGEWSLSIGCAAWATCGDMQEDTLYRLFGCAQLDAFKEASHGSFFWNWTERDGKEWNFQQAQKAGLLSGPAPLIPAWNGIGEDPLEQEFHPSPSRPHICWGDTVCLRVFHGRYVDVQGTKVHARWPDKGQWQEFVFRPNTDAVGNSAEKVARRKLRSGDVVRLEAHNGTFLSVNGEKVVASRRAKSVANEFVLHFQGAPFLTHRALIYLESKATSLVVNADEEDEGLFAQYAERGWYQQLAVEKPPAPIETERSPPKITPKKKQSLVEDDSPAAVSPKKAGAKRKMLSPSPRCKLDVSFGVAHTPSAKSLKMY